MRAIRTAEFERALKKLSGSVRRLCRVQEAHLIADWRDPRLHIKKLHGLDGVYSFRVTRSYRALFYFDADGNIILFEIDNRKDVYR